MKTLVSSVLMFTCAPVLAAGLCTDSEVARELDRVKAANLDLVTRQASWADQARRFDAKAAENLAKFYGSAVGGGLVALGGGFLGGAMLGGSLAAGGAAAGNFGAAYGGALIGSSTGTAVGAVGTGVSVQMIQQVGADSSRAERQSAKILQAAQTASVGYLHQGDLAAGLDQVNFRLGVIENAEKLSVGQIPNKRRALAEKNPFQYEGPRYTIFFDDMNYFKTRAHYAQAKAAYLGSASVALRERAAELEGRCAKLGSLQDWEGKGGDARAH